MRIARSLGGRELTGMAAPARRLLVTAGVALGLASGVASVLASVLASVTTAAADRAPASAARSKGLSLEQIRGVMRAHAGELNACFTAASRNRKPFHGPFVYQIEVDRKGKVLSARPFQPSAVAAFDRCVTDVLLRARFPGGPASVEAPLVFESR